MDALCSRWGQHEKKKKKKKKEKGIIPTVLEILL
jgi:hypothetical protein